MEIFEFCSLVYLAEYLGIFWNIRWKSKENSKTEWLTNNICMMEIAVRLRQGNLKCKYLGTSCNANVVSNIRKQFQKIVSIEKAWTISRTRLLIRDKQFLSSLVNFKQSQAVQFQSSVSVCRRLEGRRLSAVRLTSYVRFISTYRRTCCWGHGAEIIDFGPAINRGTSYSLMSLCSNWI